VTLLCENWLQQRIDVIHLLFGDLAWEALPPEFSYKSVTVVD
jgi:hypothetical protein